MIEKRYFVKPGEESADSSMAQEPDQTAAAAADTTAVSGWFAGVRYRI